MTELMLLGTSHRVAPVALRERIALSEREAARFATGLCSEPGISEAVAISTCNRTEVYAVLDGRPSAEDALMRRLGTHAGIAPEELSQATYAMRNCDAARHLYRVTGGLESMIVGEYEVQGQVRRAYEHARETGTSGPLSNRLFTAALHTGRRVRTETGIARLQVSLSSVAVELAERLLGDLGGRPVVVIGAGETSELTAQALAARGVATIFIANRHADRARSVAERFGGSVVGLEALPETLEAADIVLASTSSPHPIVGRDELELVMAARGGRPLLLIDIAVPRDIDPLCAELEGVTLRDIDDLQAAVTHNLSSREADVPAAEAIVEEEIQRFALWLGAVDVRPTIGALHARGEGIVASALEENAGRWESASPRDLARVEALARSIVGRLLHEPTIRLKSLDAERVHGSIELLRDLFALRGDGEPTAQEAEEAAPDNVRELRTGTPWSALAALRLGTRGSPLALRQAELVASAIEGEVETVVLRTGGDLGAGGDKRRWVDTIEAALLDGEIDLAVHSAKDLPAELAEGLEIVAAPLREDARDALCGASASVAALPVRAHVGTSSLRRRAQLLALRDDLDVLDLHGNVDTRLRRLAEGDFDAIVLAVAGLRRLGREGYSATDELLPAAGQGTLALEARAGDERVGAAVAPLRDDATERALAAERTLVRVLGAGCDTPVGAHARTLADGTLELHAFVGCPDGGQWIRDAVTGTDPGALGEEAARRLLSCGAGALLG